MSVETGIITRVPSDEELKLLVGENPDKELSGVDELNDMLDDSQNTTVETNFDTTTETSVELPRDLSPAERFAHGASRFAVILETRARNRLHARAINEDVAFDTAKKQDKAARDLDSFYNTPLASDATPEDAMKRIVIRQEQANKLHETTYTPEARKAAEDAQSDQAAATERIQAAQALVEQNNARETAERKARQAEAFEQAILEAKAAVKRTGRSALNHTVNAGVIALGVGLIAGETVAKTTVAAAEKTKSAVELGIGMGLNATDTAMEKTAQIIDKGEDFARGAIEKGKDLAKGAVETGKETFISYREKLTIKAIAAEKRKDARRIRWAGKRAEYKARGHEAIDTTKEKGRNGIGRLHAARAAGGAALSAIASAKAAASSTYSTHIDQNRS